MVKEANSLITFNSLTFFNGNIKGDLVQLTKVCQIIVRGKAIDFPAGEYIMKKVITGVVIILIVAGLWYAISSRVDSGAPGGSEGAAKSASATGGTAAERTDAGNAADAGLVEPLEEGEDGLDEPENMDERPATDRYKTADEALKAIKDAAANYDDLVLDQFTQLGDNCTWCDSFYASVKELMLSPDTKPDQRSYFAEVLAISGRVENLKTLVDAIVNAKGQDEADAYAEALELTVGKDDAVRFLGEQLSQQNETLREASVAAITNQGSKLAVDTLYNHTVEKGDPDGYYSLGIGLGELVPEEEAMPYLQELAMKRDQYSHLAVKALLNSGLEGLKVVMDVLSNSRNPDFDREMLKGARDHVAYDEDVMAYLKQVSESSGPGPRADFAKEVLADFQQSQQEAQQDEASAPEAAAPAAPMSMMPPAGQ